MATAGTGTLGGAAGWLLVAALSGRGDAVVLGASGAVTAVLVYAALRAPRTPYLSYNFV